MKIELTEEEFKQPFYKLLKGLVETNDVSNYAVDVERKSINIMVSGWNVDLNNDGTWSIA